MRLGGGAAKVALRVWMFKEVAEATGLHYSKPALSA